LAEAASIYEEHGDAIDSLLDANAATGFAPSALAHYSQARRLLRQASDLPFADFAGTFDLHRRAAELAELDVLNYKLAATGAPSVETGPVEPLPPDAAEVLADAVRELRDAIKAGNSNARVNTAVAILALLVAILAIVLGYVAPPGDSHDHEPAAPERQQQPPSPIKPVDSAPRLTTTPS
jgi:hypothetical protein